MPKTSSQERAERRRAARFAADYRVVCRLGHDALTTATRDLSLGGMRLAYTGRVTDLPGDFHIDLGDGEPPLRVRGHAVGGGTEGLRVEFERNELARERIRRLIRGQIIPSLEETIRQDHSPERIDELAACLREVGLVDDAIQLYRDFSPPPRTTTAAALTEIERLRASIRRQRRMLYAGFQRLLKDRNRLRQLTGEGAVDAAPQEHERLTTLLRGVRREVEILEGGTDPADRPPAIWTRWLHALRRHRLGVAAGLAASVIAMTIGRCSAPSAQPPMVTSRVQLATPAPTDRTASEPVSAQISADTEHIGSDDIDALLDKLAAEHDELTRRARQRARSPHDARNDQASETAPASRAPVQVSEPTPVAPRGKDPDFERALGYLRDRKVALAVVALQRVVSRFPEHAEAHRLLGLSYVLIEQRGRARLALTRFLELAPEHARAMQVRRVLASLSASD